MDEQASSASVRRTRFSLIWLIPVVVVAVAAWLAWTTLSSRGPEITITFDTADGITAGQTQVKHKAVALGTVENVGLSKDLKTVVIRVRMNAQAAPFLTSNAQFWVVRPRLSGATVSGLDTLVSGAYIAVDPGAPGGTQQSEFVGKESPPGVRSDEPGRTYTLMTDEIGSISQGAPVFFRDVVVGEVLGYTMPPGGRGPIPIKVFVREPYDRYLRADTRFWNVSGIRASFNGGSLHIEVESLQAVLSGGVAFGLPEQRRSKDAPSAPDNAVFKLYASKDDADSAGYRDRIPMVTYFKNSVKGIDAGSPVTMFGLQIGSVTGVSLQLDKAKGTARVRVAMEIQPERVLPDDLDAPATIESTARALVNNGLRAETGTGNLITGSSEISLAFVPNDTPASISMEGDAIVLPSKAGGVSGIMESVSAVADKIAAMPLTQIGENLNNLLAHTDSTVNGPQMRQALASLTETLKSVQHLSQHADQGITPLMQRLPAIADQLQGAVTHANAALAAYGGDSDFHHSLQQTLDQLNETARSVRLLADFISRHPSALLLGRHKP
ncbi:MlaD family protein [Acetobacteraceae bacterium KSS8]|uniref:MlaD family protein n=1 Tax=Endosaccharibacter trunci TaxID=2812733 RepID=A0ABT1W8N5_9PROT|nr:MlaD family protein [Acetobacteraceae bacterium KSS8]